MVIKRLWIALVTIVLVITACVIGRQHQLKCIDEALATLEEIEALPQNEMIAFSEELNDSFTHASHTFQLYMNHTDIESAKNAIVSLCSAVRYHDITEIMSAIEFARAQLQRLRDIDAAAIENVL